MVVWNFFATNLLHLLKVERFKQVAADVVALPQTQAWAQLRSSEDTCACERSDLVTASFWSVQSSREDISKVAKEIT